MRVPQERKPLLGACEEGLRGKRAVARGALANSVQSERRDRAVARLAADFG